MASAPQNTNAVTVVPFSLQTWEQARSQLLTTMQGMAFNLNALTGSNSLDQLTAPWTYVTFNTGNFTSVRSDTTPPTFTNDRYMNAFKVIGSTMFWTLAITFTTNGAVTSYINALIPFPQGVSFQVFPGVGGTNTAPNGMRFAGEYTLAGGGGALRCVIGQTSDESAQGTPVATHAELTAIGASPLANATQYTFGFTVAIPVNPAPTSPVV